MKSKKRSLLVILTAVLSIAIWSAALYHLGADAIVEFVGLENGYLVMFLVSLFGGLSSFGGATYLATTVTLAAAGMNPVTIALVAALGTIIGDSFYFVASHYGSDYLIDHDIGTYVDRLTKWLQTKPRYVLWFFIYFYTAVTPFPNDVLTISLGVTRQPYFLVISALALGNFTFVLLLAVLGTTLF